MNIRTEIPSEEIKIKDPVANPPGSTAIGFDKNAHPNASAILYDNLERNPDAIAVTGPAGTKTYGELCADASRWGNALTGFGLDRGDRIAVFLDDTPAYPAVVMGAIRAGFVPVLLNTQTRSDLLNFYLSDSEATIAVVDADMIDMFDQQAVANTKLKRIVVTNGTAQTGPVEQIPATEFLSGQPDTLPVADTGPDDMAFWMYSSGSTGRPKGIVHLQHDMAYTALTYAREILKLTPADRCFSVPKIFFAYGFGNAVTFPFAAGASVVLMPGRPEASRVLAAIEEWKPTAFFALPTVYTALARAPEIDRTDLSSLRISLSAAEILSEDVFNAWREQSGLEALEGLGSTELLHIYLSNTVAEKRLGSAGKVVKGYEVKLCDPDGNEVSEGEEGVMWVRGHSSAPHYWNQPEKTSHTMRQDWIYTGDRFVERDGFYFFQGRADDLVKVSGQWVWPLEVERCLSEHPEVHECAVLAEQLADKRTILRAIVVPREGVGANELLKATLRDHVKEHLLPFKAPRIFEFRISLPKTGTGKIDRQALVTDRPGPDEKQKR